MGLLTQSTLVIRKAAAAVSFPGFGGQSWYGGAGGWTWPLRQIGEREYRMLVGNGEDSSIVTACVNWIANQAMQAPPAVRRYAKDDALGQYVRDHPAARLMLRPTWDTKINQSYYSWLSLMKATLIALVVDGNAYWLKIRSKSGRVVQLWYVPTWMLMPRWPLDGSTFISHYDYFPSGASPQVPILPTEVVHFRDGIDPNNTRMGLSQLKTLLREIYTDEEAARWTASLLKNQGVPGIVVSPGSGGGIPGAEDVKEIKARFMAEFTGDHRGEPIVMSGPTEIKQYGYSPDAMKLGDLRDIPEERVSAVIGVPAAIAGLGTGLQSTKTNATMEQLVDLGWMNGVLPRQKIIAVTATEQLLPDFDQGEIDEIEFDTSRVAIMADHNKKLAETHQSNYRWGVEMRGEAKRALGLRAGPEDDIYVLQSGASTVKPDGEVISGKDVALANEPLAPGDAAAVNPDGTPMDQAAIDNAEPQLALAPPAGKALTARESEILTMLAKGKSNSAIADQLVISERTVERHVASILAKRGVKSRLALLGVEVKLVNGAAPLGEKLEEVADLVRDHKASETLELLREIEKSAERRDAALMAGLREIAGREITLQVPQVRVGAVERIVTERDAHDRVVRVIERPILVEVNNP